MVDVLVDNPRYVLEGGELDAPDFADIGAATEVTWSGDDLLVRFSDASLTQAQIDEVEARATAAFIPPVSAPPPAPVQPTATPTPSVVGGVRSLSVTLPPVSNETPIRAKVYISTTTPVPRVDSGAGQTLHGLAEGTLYRIDAMPDGTPLASFPQGTVFHVVVVASNDAGDGPVSPEASAALQPIDTDDFAATYAYFGEVDVDQLTGGSFRLDQGTVTQIEAVGVNGERVGMAAINTTDPDAMNGFYSLGAPEVAGQQGPIRVHFPVDGKPNIVSGQSEFDTLAVNQSATFEGTVTISPGKQLVLGGQVQAPKVAPTVVPSWHTVEHPAPPRAERFAGLTVGHDGRWYTAARETGAGISKVRVYNTNGTLFNTIDAPVDDAYDPAGGIVYAAHNGGRYYLLTQQVSGALAGHWYIESYDTAFTRLWREHVYDSDLPRTPAVGWDHVTAGGGRLLLAASTGGHVIIDAYTVDAAGNPSWVADGSPPTSFAYDFNLAYVARVSTESGDRYIFRRQGIAGENFQVFTATTPRTQQTSEQWPSASTSGPIGAWYDGTRFWSLTFDGRQRHRYETGRAMWTSGSANREISYDWSSASGAHTTPSPKASLTLPKRARISVTTQTIPTGAGGATDPSSARVFVGVGTGVANGSMNLEKTITAPATTWSLDSTVAQESPTTHPATSNTFTGGVPAALVGAGATFIDATGAIPAGPFRDSVRAEATTVLDREDSGDLAASGVFAGTVRFIRIGKLVTVSGFLARATGFNNSFAATGIVVPATLRPPSTEANPNLPVGVIYASSPVSFYQYRVNTTTGDLEVRQSAAFPNQLQAIGNYTLP